VVLAYVSNEQAVAKHLRCVRRVSARFARGGTVTKPVFLAESLESGEVVLAESVESGECEGLAESVVSVALGLPDKSVDEGRRCSLQSL
jgi:hypothetical protein